VSTNRFAGTGHILIVGWSASTPVVLEEFTETELARGKKVVILSPRIGDRTSGLPPPRSARPKARSRRRRRGSDEPRRSRAGLARSAASAILVQRLGWRAERTRKHSPRLGPSLGLSGPKRAIAVPIVVLVHSVRIVPGGSAHWRNARRADMPLPFHAAHRRASMPPARGPRGVPRTPLIPRKRHLSRRRGTPGRGDIRAEPASLRECLRHRDLVRRPMRH
jgi:hypothetical protein